MSPEMRVAAAARLEVLRALERNGRIPDCGELARAIEETVRRELLEAELAGEMKTTRQYCRVLEDLFRSTGHCTLSGAGNDTSA